MNVGLVENGEQREGSFNQLFSQFHGECEILRGQKGQPGRAAKGIAELLGAVYFLFNPNIFAETYSGILTKLSDYTCRK